MKGINDCEHGSSCTVADSSYVCQSLNTDLKQIKHIRTFGWKKRKHHWLINLNCFIFNPDLYEIIISKDYYDL